ncbi:MULTISPECIES: 3-oxoacyl-ACP reductase family protein [Pseudoalteromonas]|uniref:3-oxoacyl-ACP reductase family protein n=1 Tax=Pseudoalteromonas TaxID=53246 RepID=UPI001EF5BB0A|nr:MULTISPECIES: 3-oxoacyl-ACP reductase family protein [Pseudoalteromonas]MCG7539016.1 3-oxoacyl-ACP reductase FabG [Pseudoalteromonas sp. OF7H-1]MCG9771281.1 3-oxoacyl-ACP reductase FabG [Pseudoalteromonas piscicida]
MNKTKWVLVTGGTRGIGEAIVRELAVAGYRVVFTYKSSQLKAESISASLTEEGYLCEAHQCDMTQFSEVGELAKKLEKAYGAPYALVNNAGITKDAILLNMELEHWEEVMDTNLNSQFYVLKSLVKSMLMQGGCIVNVSSVTAFKANPGQINYAATKAATIAMTKTLARELGRFNIRVNSLAPGLIETEMTSKIDERSMNSMFKSIPLGRIGQVHDVAPAVLFLLGAGGNYITGQTLVIDGGFTA